MFHKNWSTSIRLYKISLETTENFIYIQSSFCIKKIIFIVYKYLNELSICVVCGTIIYGTEMVLVIEYLLAFSGALLILLLQLKLTAVLTLIRALSLTIISLRIYLYIFPFETSYSLILAKCNTFVKCKL